MSESYIEHTFIHYLYHLLLPAAQWKNSFQPEISHCLKLWWPKMNQAPFDWTVELNSLTQLGSRCYLSIAQSFLLLLFVRRYFSFTNWVAVLNGASSVEPLWEHGNANGEVSYMQISHATTLCLLFPGVRHTHVHVYQLMFGSLVFVWKQRLPQCSKWSQYSHLLEI